MRLEDGLQGEAWRLLQAVEARCYDELRNNLLNLTPDDRAILRAFYKVQMDEQVVHLAAQFHNIHH
jgi:hypothetical protein